MLAGLFKRTAIAEMIHIEKLAERIIFLKGDVEMAAAMETSSADDYNKWAIECSNNADLVSKSLFEELVLDEETHFDQYDVEMENLEKFGMNYLALQSIERSKNLAAGRPAD